MSEPIVDTAPNTAWYALWTRSRHEKVVRQHLILKGFEVFLPTVYRWNRWKDRCKRIEFPLFPGYCFARFNTDHALPILNCPGVSSIISLGGKPTPIPNQEIDGIRRVLQTSVSCNPCSLI